MLPDAELILAKEEVRLREAIPGFVLGNTHQDFPTDTNPTDSVTNDEVTEKFIAKQAAMLRQVKDERDCFATLCAENFDPPCVEFNWLCPMKDKRGFWSNVAGCPKDKVVRSDCYLRFVIAEVERIREVEVERKIEAGQS